MHIGSKIEFDAHAYQDLQARQWKEKWRGIKQRSRNRFPIQSEMPIRPKRDITVFGPRFLVVCPRCSGRADLETRDNLSKTSLDCSSCDYARQWQSSQIGLATPWRWLGNVAHPVPTGFGGTPAELWVETSSDATQQSQGLTLRLWLQTPCEAENLWFLNRQHLDFVEHYLRDSVDREDERAQIQWVEPWIEHADKSRVTRCVEELISRE